MPRSTGDASQSVHAALLNLPEVALKRMFGANAFFTRGRMFAFLLGEAVVLKLPERERQALIASGEARPFLTSGNAPFGRWVEIGIEASAAKPETLRLVRLAHQLAQTPDREGPRRRRLATKRRSRSSRIQSDRSP